MIVLKRKAFRWNRHQKKQGFRSGQRDTVKRPGTRKHDQKEGSNKSSNSIYRCLYVKEIRLNLGMAHKINTAGK
jgi:hypothetical protein